MGGNMDALAGLAAHEGFHVAEGSAWTASGFSPALDPKRSQAEFGAYQVQVSIAQDLNPNAWGYIAHGSRGNYLLWSSLPNWQSGYTNLAINGLIKSEYPNANIAAFSRNTKVMRPQQ
jgi:hypothetical protein